MGKRSDFKRVERDFYETPLAAVIPLVPHLTGSEVYCEPCAGAGALIRHLSEAAGLRCGAAYDIEPQCPSIVVGDALGLTSGDMTGCTHVITNPPWDRKILHPMIERFAAIKPTWLLFDADWIHTKQSAAFMPWLVKVVSVGRVKWIPGSKMTGKDNCCWYLFDANHTGQTTFHGRSQ